MIEDDRARMHQLVDERYDMLISNIKSGKNISMKRTMSLASNPFVFKGRKPVSITLPSGEMILTPKWKSVVIEILKDCNADTEMHYRMMKLCGITAGRFRMLLGHDPSKMDSPLKIDDDIYFESKFDTEYLIKMMTEKVLDQVGYDYSDITVTMHDRLKDFELDSQADAPEEDENEDENPSMQMM